LLFSYIILFKKKVPFPGDLVLYKFNYLYTTIPLSLFKIKIEVKIRGDVIMYNIHFLVIVDYKSNGIINKTKKN